MTDVSDLRYVVALHTDNEKLSSFLNSLIPDFEAGRITYEEIEEAVMDNLKEFVSFDMKGLRKIED